MNIYASKIIRELYTTDFMGTCVGSCILSRVLIYVAYPEHYMKLRRKEGSTVLNFYIKDGEVL